MRGLLLLGLLLPMLGAQEQTLRIAGKVVNAASGQALENVRVVLFVREKELAAVTTKGDGHFEFAVRKGTYSLRAERNGLGRQPYGARSLADGYGVGIIVDGTAQYNNIVFRVFPPSSISGKVVDSAGDPVENALVQLFRSTAFGGRKKAIARGSFYTDDRGEYRFGNLPSGSYYVMTSGTPWHVRFMMRGGPEQKAVPTYLPAYHPNTTNPNAATPLTLRTGEDARANFELTEGLSHGIQLQVEGDMKVSGRVTLTIPGPAGVKRFQHVATLYGNNLYIPAVPPGAYELTVTGENKNGVPVMGTANVDAGNAELTLTVTPTPAAHVTGKVTCDGRPIPPGSSTFVTIWTDLLPVPGRVPISPDGSFVIPALPKGQYLFSLSGGICYPTRVLRDDKELSDRTLIMDGQEISGLTIESAAGMAELKGFVRKGDAKASGVYAFLAPAKDSKDAGDYPSYMTDSDGSFQFQNVRPGEYWLYAVDEDEFEYANRAVIEPYLKQAEKIVIAPSGKHEKDIELTLPRR